MRDEVRAARPAGLIVADLGTEAGLFVPGIPTVVLDHHVPRGAPEGAVTISGYGEDPTPSTSLLAWRCLKGVAEVDDLLWIAALGMIGDYGEKAPFPELAEARSRHGGRPLREATSLVNAPRRSSTGDAAPALALLMRAEGPEEVLSEEAPEAGALRAARDEVRRELEAARRLPPRFAGEVALIELGSRCQIHPLVAQSWTGRLRRQIVIVANSGFRDGHVHFAARSATGRNLVEFLRERAPAGAEAPMAAVTRARPGERCPWRPGPTSRRASASGRPRVALRPSVNVCFTMAVVPATIGGGGALPRRRGATRSP